MHAQSTLPGTWHWWCLWSNGWMKSQCMLSWEMLEIVSSALAFYCAIWKVFLFCFVSHCLSPHRVDQLSPKNTLILFIFTWDSHGPRGCKKDVFQTLRVRALSATQEPWEEVDCCGQERLALEGQWTAELWSNCTEGWEADKQEWADETVAFTAHWLGDLR